MTASATGAFGRALQDAFRGKHQNLAFGLYLAALALLGLKWLSAVSWIQEHAIWSDLFIAAAAAAWCWDQLIAGRRPRPRAFHLALALYLVAVALSTAFAGDKETALRTMLLVTELCVLAVLTSEFASDRERLDAIVWTVCLVSLYTAILVAAGLVLFYAGDRTDLLGAYGEQFIRSDRYARVAAGFESPPLLASYCIFASALVARDGTTLPNGLRHATQVALGVVVLLTFSRGILGFAAALAIRAGYRHRERRSMRVVTIGVVVVAVAVLCALTVGRLHVDPSRPSTATYEVPDPGNRREAVVTSLETFADEPITGEGPGSLVGENRGEPFRAHLTPLNVAATMGLPALAALTFLLLTLWRNRRRPTPIATWSGMAGLGIDALAQDIEHFRHVWVMIGVADADRSSKEPPP